MVRLVRLNREPAINNLFNRFFEGESVTPDFIPATNIKESDEAFELNVAVPGYKKEQVNIELKENLLTISAAIETKKEESEWHKEFTVQSFSKTFVLPKNVDIEAIKADQNDGILRVQIPKKKEEQKVKKRIEIA